MRNNRVLRGGAVALASAAVAGVAVAGVAIARADQTDGSAAAGGGPGTPSAPGTPSTDPDATPSTDPGATPSTDPGATPSTDPGATPSTDPGATPSTDPGATPSTDPGATPSAGPGATPSTGPGATPSAIPGGLADTPGPSDATPSTIGERKSVTRPTPPQRPKEYPLPKDAVAACKSLLATADQSRPGRNAKPVARLDGDPGSIVVLADAKHWAACDTAYARQNGEGSLRAPAPIAKSSTINAFAVAANLIPRSGKDHNYYWAAGLLPNGVARISYTFPDGQTAQAVVQGNYWLMQHQAAKPWTPGSDAGEPRITVKLARADGSVIRTFKLEWGTHTCAQITHGC